MKSISEAGTDIDRESGFSLVEIIISMVLLALIAVAFLPLLVNAMKASVKNSTMSTASQLAGQQLDVASSIAPYCDTVSAFDDAAVPDVTDQAGIVYQFTRLVGACPATYPGLVTVTVSVSKDAENLAEAVTQLYLTGDTAPVPSPSPSP